MEEQRPRCGAGKYELPGGGAMIASAVRWGATVSESKVRLGDRMPEWKVIVESEQLDAPLGDAVLARFAEATARLLPDVKSSCSVRDDRIGMTLTIAAPEVELAADSAARAFGGALAAALWPRYRPSRVAQWRVRVAPVEPALCS